LTSPVLVVGWESTIPFVWRDAGQQKFALVASIDSSKDNPAVRRRNG
jgi:hypothetical protein